MPSFLPMNWGGQLRRNLRPFYHTNLGYIQPASLFACILTQFIPPEPGAFQTKACDLPLDVHSQVTGNQIGFPKSIYISIPKKTRRGIGKEKKEKERKEQNMEEKIEKELIKASPHLRLCAFTSPSFLM